MNDISYQQIEFHVLVVLFMFKNRIDNYLIGTVYT